MRAGAWSLAAADGSPALAWLAKARGGVRVDRPTIVHAAAFDGDPTAFLASAGGSEALAVQLRNKVRKCPVCAKPNAYTLSTCNGCSSDLRAVPVSFTHNIFSSFVYGIARGPFPFTISIRHESESLIVLDDLLALTRVHLNVLPTTHYIPDWTALLARPRDALALITHMEEQCWAVVMQQFWPHASELLARVPSADALRSHVCAGFNYPPSQYQLHLQYMLPPFVPFQWLACLKGVHFTYGRFFPLEYVRRVLQSDGPHYRWVEGESTIEQLIQHYARQHINYDAIHSASLARFYRSHELLANWNAAADFAGAVVGSQFVPFGGARNGDEPQLDWSAATPIDSADAVAAADKLTLQSYGRPYDAAGKPTGTYYGYARKQPMPFFA